MSLAAFPLHDSALPEHCAPTSLYLEKFSSAFHSCVPTTLAFLSTSLGIVSIIAWLFAQMPQIYKNYRLQSASGLSVYFLAEWLLGDITNLLGALLTGQASWQVAIATYYVIVDVSLTSQFFWFTHIKPWKKRRVIVYENDDPESPDCVGDGMANGMAVSPEIAEDVEHLTSNAAVYKPGKPSNEKTTNHKKQYDEAAITLLSNEKNEYRAPSSVNTQIGRRLPTLLVSFAGLATAASLSTSDTTELQPNLSTSALSSGSETAGRIFSWASTVLYLGSRLPQIYKNSVRRSTSGLSPYMFLATFSGNFFYSAALMTNPLAWRSYPSYGGHGWAGPEGSDRFEWVSLAIPFWLGAAGVLVLDATVGLQFLAYREKAEEVEVLVEDRRGRGTWRTVSSWMRGWVPSPGGAKREDGEEDEESPLVVRRRSRSTNYGAT